MNRQRVHLAVFALLAMCMTQVVRSASAPKPPPAVSQGKDGKLAYVVDEHGDRVPDYSYAGYMAGETAIPTATVRVHVMPIAGDNTARIQAAIDYVASLPADDHGMRGAVLLDKGKYEIAGALKIRAAGVVLRGSGAAENGTTLIATGTDRRTLITIAGANDRKTDGEGIKIADAYVPVNAMQFHVAAASSLKPGDTILIHRPSTAEWVNKLGMNETGGGIGLGWHAGSRDIMWDCTITAAQGDQITIDSPVTTALDSTFGTSTITRYTWPGRINQSGVENLRCESAFDAQNLKDEEHSWMAIAFENAQDCWARQITVAHFVGSAVSIWDSCKRVTVEDVRSLAPVSEIAGYRRHTFFTDGQQTLFQRCWSEQGRHDFAVGSCAPGPNAFVQCEAADPLDDSGPIDSWASGVLYDNVRIDGHAINLCNLGFQNAFAGWNAANSMLYQCNASLLQCFNPPGAHNWAIGCWGQFNGDGGWFSSNESVKPASLYYAQLADRLGRDAMTRADLLLVSSDAASSPTIDVAAQMIAASVKPQATLADWIDHAGERHSIPADAAGAKSLDDVAKTQATSNTAPTAAPMKLRNGQLVIGDKPIIGGRDEVAWWRGGIRPADLEKPQAALTRYVPGREGPGLTDNLEDVAEEMLREHRVAMEQHYGLWYDRRDDDHERVHRMNGDAWPPFFEYPFARSGQGVEWDGLSKYDLTKYNPWYFSRVKQFADLCDQKGLVLINQQFFQHNIIEAGAHWASCPWRSANNINNMGFPEPPPYVGDKRIFMAEQFYDVTNTTRTAIYRAYIRKCLDNLADNTNVIHETGAEFTGPLHFMQFWIDTVAQWEKETGKHPMIGLACTKDVQDAILSDPARAKVIDVIDIRFWWYQTGGEAYAPPGGKNLAPRQFERVIKHKGASADQVERAVREYRQQFPDKAVIYSADSAERFGQAVFSAGGSLANVRGGGEKQTQ